MSAAKTYSDEELAEVRRRWGTEWPRLFATIDTLKGKSEFSSELQAALTAWREVSEERQEGVYTIEVYNTDRDRPAAQAAVRLLKAAAKTENVCPKCGHPNPSAQHRCIKLEPAVR